MARKPARMWRYVRGPAYTRKEYIGGVPHPRIVIFDMGEPHGDYDLALHLISKEWIQIRHNALEAARVAANQYLIKTLGKNNYYLKIRIYPHHVLREHKMAVGAGADRISKGMRMAFGKPVGTAARVKPGQKIMTVWIKRDQLDAAKEALRRASMKLPAQTRVEIEELKAPASRSNSFAI